MDYQTSIRNRAQRLAPTGARQAPQKKEHLNLRDIQRKRFEADQDWNRFCVAHLEEKERYERKFDELSAKCALMDSYAAEKAFEDLMFHEERQICIGTETEPGLFYWHSRMDYWREMEAKFGIDKWTQDDLLNEMQHWYKVLWREDNPIHHAHEAAKGKSVLMPDLRKPIEKSRTRRSTAVKITANPL